ncbi:hypothetical protein P171DRAFT_481314 [Karstenula rhodostoma CBS 690.94]|uniref:Uncharacterized protein n=1 Tax=Karstenula rhodostoma CBS 690.94 TaxID=1392251 RepID=A0A9P4PPY0_9PLEO|nr:hypothetical protein P171DRAFT_481314 [Karstenula rhodostoma CBS 690.94]
MTPLYLVIKTQTSQNTKPNYTVADIVPHGLPFPPSPSATHTISSYHIARNIPHVTASITETYDIKLSWPYDAFPAVAVVAASNDKEAAGIAMHEAVDAFVEEAAGQAGERGEEMVKRRIKTSYDAEYDLVFAAGMETGRGEHVCFEMFCVEIGPGRVDGAEGVIGRGRGREGLKEDADGRGGVGGDGDVEMEDVFS